MTDSTWSIAQTVELFDLCSAAKHGGKSLTQAFRTVAEKTGRSLNSVRNYYYSQARTFELVPEIAEKLGIKRAGVQSSRFVPFEAKQVRSLVRNVLIAKGKGISVRKAISALAGGDGKLALRYQNKYRSVLRSHRDLVESVMSELKKEGLPCGDPYAKESDNFARLTEYIATLDDSRVGKFLSIIEKLT